MEKKNKIDMMIGLCVLILIIFGYILVNSIMLLNETGNIYFPNEDFSAKNFNLYFAPNENNIEKVLDTINNSKEEIHCALRALNHKKLENILKNKENDGVKVRLFIDSDYMGNKDIYLPYTRFSSSEELGMMHNNYCIIDNQIVFTGSLIFNNNTILQNFHDILIINSTELASEYNSDFWIMYNNQTTTNKQYRKEFIKINEELFVKPCFSPYENCQDLIVDAINISKGEINFAVYSFTNEKITKALIEKELYQNTPIKGVIDARGVVKTTINYQIMDWIKVNIGKRRIHTKIFRLGEDLSITGSMNPTLMGVGKNNENILLIKSKEVSKSYESFIKNYAIQDYGLNGKTYY